MRRNMMVVALSFSAVVAAGCSRSELTRVGGCVMLDGVPLADAFIEFLPASPEAGTVSYGKTNSEGVYEMQFSGREQGVLPGEYRIRIHTADVVDGPGRKTAMSREFVPDRYNSRRSELVRTVEAGKHNRFDFELSGKGRTTQPRLADY